MGKWNYDRWEHDNQDKLRQWYAEKITGIAPNLKVRLAKCPVCGKFFYTQVDYKKYCFYETCGRNGWHHVEKMRRLEARTDKVCPVCGKKFTPKRGDAICCSNACRQKRYRNSKKKNQVDILPT